MKILMWFDSDSDAMIRFKLLLSLFIKGLVKRLNWKKSGAKIGSAILKFTSTIATLKYHIHVKRAQCNHQNSIKSNLGRNDILVHVHYSKGYENKQQDEIQKVYFGHTSFSIFTVCCYLRDSEGNLISDSITITNKLPDHSRDSAIIYLSKVLENVREKSHNLLFWTNVFVWRNEYAAPFQSRYDFTMLSTSFDTSVSTPWQRCHEGF